MTLHRPIFLIGYRGTGKSTVARLLAERMNCSWIDADVVLEEHAGKTIRQIFADDGESAFRDLEAAILDELANTTATIIATGGGVIVREANRHVLKKGFIVWLRAPAEVLWRRLIQDATTRERRPNLSQGGLDEIEEMLRIRTPIYEACADLTIDTELNTPAEIAEAIARVCSHMNEPEA